MITSSYAIRKRQVAASSDWWLASGIPEINIYDYFENLTVQTRSNYPTDSYIPYVLAVQVDTWPTTGTPYLWGNGSSSGAWFSNPTPGATQLTFRITNINYAFSTNVVPGDVIMMTYNYPDRIAYFYHNATLLGTSGTASDNFASSVFWWGADNSGNNDIGDLPKAFMANVFQSEQKLTDLYIAMAS